MACNATKEGVQCCAIPDAVALPQMAPMANGRVQIQYRQVECAPPSNINIVVNQNAGAGGWLRLTVQVKAFLADTCP